MWLALQGKLNTRQRLCDRGILQEDQIACPLCALQPESLDHILLSCSYSQQVWKSISEEMGKSLSLPESFQQHYESWMVISWRSRLSKRIWVSTFFAIAWSFWMTRNEVLFQQKIFNQEAICQSVKRQVAFWNKAWKERLPCTEEEFASNFANISVILQ